VCVNLRDNNNSWEGMNLRRASAEDVLRIIFNKTLIKLYFNGEQVRIENL
jgi:hypothetical protein